MEFLPQPSITVNLAHRWNSPRVNVQRIFARFWTFIIMGANDAAYGALTLYIEEYYRITYIIVSPVLSSSGTVSGTRQRVNNASKSEAWLVVGKKSNQTASCWMRDACFWWWFVVLKLVGSCRWGCGLGNLSTILEMKVLRRQLYMQLPRMFISANPASCAMHSFFFH